jgi:uncharacterized protein (DUF302 family)
VSVEVSRRTVEVAHVVIHSAKRFGAVRAALEQLVPHLDAEIPALVSAAPTERLRQRLQAGPELSIFLELDHGAVLRLYGVCRNAIQYLIGNPLTASKMTRFGLAAGLYAPLRVIFYETDEGGSRFEYDLPSSLFGQFGDERITEVARALDVELGRVLSAAAG